ncbi:hypothetical protein Q9L58_008724 [Maublancomyces gigas]|uniref:S-adenosyl-L-methionine-dependent methyltransferase n=1 Tax=Discina gigas TaxID=1032678 RepID=A0ABR3G990_9PEZI
MDARRLDIMHHALLLLLDNRLHLAPIGPNPTRILDIGTGTGIWAIDAGDRYPGAEVIGTDLSPIQPGWVPPNVYFQIDDAESEWTFAKDSFDLIHIRHLSGSIKDWGALIEQVYKHLKPGGYIDICELEMHLSSDDGTAHPGLDLSKYCELLNKAAAVLGQDFETITNLKPLIERAGFVNVRHEKMRLPLGTWPVDPKQKIIGAYVLITIESGFEACGLRLLTCVLDMDQASFAVLTERAKKNAYDRNIHGYSWQ